MQRFTDTVEKGRRRGTGLGFPTINIPLPDKSISGIYAARVSIKDETPYMAAAFADPVRGTLEAHILDFEDDLVGLNVTIELLEKIRDTTDFKDDETMKAAIADDVKKVREYFKT